MTDYPYARDVLTWFFTGFSCASVMWGTLIARMRRHSREDAAEIAKLRGRLKLSAREPS